MPRPTHLSVLLILSILCASCSPQAATSSPDLSTQPPAATPAFRASASLAPASSPTPLATIAAPTITPAAAPAVPQTAASPATSVPIPEISLKQGDYFFTNGGVQGIVFVRNLGGNQVAQYIQELDLMKGKGSQLVRIQLDSLGDGYTNTGELDQTWAKNWERVFARAAQDGIDVLPVFAGWFDWNNGLPDYGYSTWKSNPLRGEAGGPATTPGELFRAGSPTQQLWLAWLKQLVERWQGQPNIAAWEIFSEVNIASGVSEASGVDFVEKAAAVIRAADAPQRPVTASLAETGEWPSFYRSAALDFINFHPYPVSGQLDTLIIQQVRHYLTSYHKPVFIGESGLSSAPPLANSATLTTAKNARIGIAHAIWAALVSGAMNGRALYWEDGFAVFFPQLSWTFLYLYNKAETPAARFARGVDFSGFRPLEARPSAKITGAALGNERTIIGWFRDAGCEPPDWNLLPVVSKQSVILTVPGKAATWQADFYDPADGSTVTGSLTVQQLGSQVTVPLPDFADAIAFKMTPQK